MRNVLKRWLGDVDEHTAKATEEPWDSRIHGDRTAWMKRTEADHAAHLESQRSDAERATNGNMVSPEGKARGVKAEDFFKPGNRRSIEQWGSPEMKTWHGSESAPQIGQRSTLGKMPSLSEYRRQTREDERQAYHAHGGEEFDDSGIDYAKFAARDLEALGRQEHPNVDHYQSGGIGHREGDETKSTVGFLPTHVVRSYREHAGDWNPDSARKVAEIKADLDKGKGLTNPVQMEYDHKLGWAYIGEGNHRVEAAHQAGLHTVPVRVYARGRNAGKKQQGIGGPAKMTTDFGHNGYDYTPPDVHPDHFEFPGGGTHAYDYSTWEGHHSHTGALSDEARVSVAESIMEDNGHSGKTWHVPKMHQDDPARKAAHQPVHDFVHHVLDSHGWESEHDGYKHRIRVMPSHWDLREPGSGQAITDGMNYIGLKGEHTNDLSLLHECAHILTGTGEGTGGHGPEFQETAKRLYHDHLSPEAGEMFGKLTSRGKQAAKNCPCCGGGGEHRCGHECYVCDASGQADESQGQVCQGHHGRPETEHTTEYGVTPENGMQHVTGAVMDAWAPTERLFAPTKGGVDPRLFDVETRVMKANVRMAVLVHLSEFWHRHGYDTAPSCVRVYLAGSQASEWYGNNDFDILVGINYDAFRARNPMMEGLSDAEVGVVINGEFREDFNDEQWHPSFDPDEWHLTGYVNKDSWDIARIKPYAAYNVTDNVWAVEPIHEPTGHHFDTTAMYYFEGVAAQVRSALALTEPNRRVRCTQLWTFIHTDRSRAFGPHGTGAFDRGNALEKYLDQAPSGIEGKSLMAALAEAKFGEQKQAGLNGDLPDGLEWHYREVKGRFAPQHQLWANHPDVQGQKAGLIRWHPETHDIIGVSVHDSLQRRGLGTELLRRAKEIDPGIKHSVDRTDEGESWAKATGDPIPKREWDGLGNRLAASAAPHQRYFLPEGGGKYHKANPITGQAMCRGTVLLDTKSMPFMVPDDATKVHPMVCRKCLGPDHPANAKQAIKTAHRAHDVYGSNDIDRLFPGGAPTTSTPWPMAPRTKSQPVPYSKDLLGKALADPGKHMAEVDPRDLHAYQPAIRRDGVKYYMGDKYKHTGETFADQHHVANQVPVVYTRHDGKSIILSGHHRAAAALLKGEPLQCLHIREEAHEPAHAVRHADAVHGRATGSVPSGQGGDLDRGPGGHPVGAHRLAAARLLQGGRRGADDAGSLADAGDVPAQVRPDGLAVVSARVEKFKPTPPPDGQHAYFRGLYLGRMAKDTFHPPVDGKGIGHFTTEHLDPSNDDHILSRIKTKTPEQLDNPNSHRWPMYGSHWTTDHYTARKFSLDSGHGQRRHPMAPTRPTWGVVLEAHTPNAPSGQATHGYEPEVSQGPTRGEATKVLAHVHHYDPDHSDGLAQDTYQRTLEVPQDHWKTAQRTAGLFGPPWFADAYDDDIDAHHMPEAVRMGMTHHTSPQGHRYRLTADDRTVYAAYLGKGENRLKKPQMVGTLQWFGGKATPDDTTIKGRISGIYVKPAHQRRGLASAMLDHARQQNPHDDIEHSTNLSDDAKGWSSVKASKAQSIEVAGVAIKAEDTGRVLMLQRSFDDETDPARGTWEFPGGHIDEGENPFEAARREWCEETGGTFPDDAPVVGNWVSGGMYQGFVVMIAAEADLDINLDHEDRHVLNPDDPDGDGIEVVAWWDLKHLKGNPAVRKEVTKGTDWDLLKKAKAPVNKKAASAEEPYLHASNVLFEPGHHVLPANQVDGVKSPYSGGHNEHYSGDHVYLYKASEVHPDFRLQGGAVYEVHPHGEVEPDPEPWRGQKGAPGSYRTKGPVTVKRLVENNWRDPSARVPAGMRGSGWKPPSEQPRAKHQAAAWTEADEARLTMRRAVEDHLQEHHPHLVGHPQADLMHRIEHTESGDGGIGTRRPDGSVQPSLTTHEHHPLVDPSVPSHLRLRTVTSSADLPQHWQDHIESFKADHDKRAAEGREDWRKPEDATGACLDAAGDFHHHVRDRSNGEHQANEEFFEHLKEVPPRRPNVEDGKTVEHLVNITHDTGHVIDWTARQFHPGADFPHVEHVSTYRDKWHHTDANPQRCDGCKEVFGDPDEADEHIATLATRGLGWHHVVKSQRGGDSYPHHSVVEAYVKQRTGVHPEDMVWTAEPYAVADATPDPHGIRSKTRTDSAEKGYRENPDRVPPIIAIEHQGKREHVDGWHRLGGAERVGMTHVPAYVGRVRPATKNSASLTSTPPEEHHDHHERAADGQGGQAGRGLGEPRGGHRGASSAGLARAAGTASGPAGVAGGLTPDPARHTQSLREMRDKVREHEGAGGQCGFVAEMVHKKHGWPSYSGFYHHPDGRVIGDHVWNVHEPSGTIVDATSDQHGEGHDVRFIHPSDPEHKRYQYAEDEDDYDRRFNEAGENRKKHGPYWWTGGPNQHAKAYEDKYGGRSSKTAAADPAGVTWHPKAAKDLKGLDKGTQKQVLDTIEGIRTGAPHVVAQTHNLRAPLKGWYSTKVSRGHRVIHQPTGDGGIHVGYVGLHEYEQAERRLAALTIKPEHAHLWPKHPLFRPGDKVLETTGNGNQYPATVHHQDESTDPDHHGTVWVNQERHGIDGVIGVHPSRLAPHPDAPAEQHEHYQRQQALNDAGTPHVPERERDIDESDRVTVHHLTDRHDFAPDHTKRPENNTTMGGSMSPRLFVGSPTAWAEGEHHYRRPYVAEMTVPKGALSNTKGYLGENQIPARHFDKVHVTRVLPYQEHRREQEEPGYHSPVDTRTWSKSQHRDQLKAHRETLHSEHGWGWNEFDKNHNHVGLGDDDWDDDMRDPNSGYPGTYVRRDKKGRPMIQPRSSLT